MLDQIAFGVRIFPLSPTERHPNCTALAHLQRTLKGLTPIQHKMIAYLIAK